MSETLIDLLPLYPAFGPLAHYAFGAFMTAVAYCAILAHKPRPVPKSSYFDLFIIALVWPVSVAIYIVATIANWLGGWNRRS